MISMKNVQERITLSHSCCISMYNPYNIKYTNKRSLVRKDGGTAFPQKKRYFYIVFKVWWYFHVVLDITSSSSSYSHNPEVTNSRETSPTLPRRAKLEYSSPIDLPFSSNNPETS